MEPGRYTGPSVLISNVSTSDSTVVFMAAGNSNEIDANKTAENKIDTLMRSRLNTTTHYANLEAKTTNVPSLMAFIVAVGTFTHCVLHS